MTTTAPSTDLTPALDHTTLPADWSSEHISPLAVFQPDRITICAEHQLALIDTQASPASAHLLAAKRHIEAALAVGVHASDRFGAESMAERLDRIAERARH